MSNNNLKNSVLNCFLKFDMTHNDIFFHYNSNFINLMCIEPNFDVCSILIEVIHVPTFFGINVFTNGLQLVEDALIVGNNSIKYALFKIIYLVIIISNIKIT